MNKILLTVILVAILCLSTLIVMPRANAGGTATGAISVVKTGTTDVSNWSIGPDSIGSTINVDLYVSGASNVWSLKTAINWTSSFLNLTSVSEGAFLKKNPSGSTLFLGNDPAFWANDSNGIGFINGGLSSTRMSLSKTNNDKGLFATLSFQVLKLGEANITLSNGQLGDITSWTDQTYSNPSLSNAYISITNSSTTYNNSYAATIDLYTNRGGIGQNLMGGFFYPQELIQLYGLVLYGNSAVPNIDVTFTVKLPNGTVFLSRTTPTNSIGVAFLDFRFPTYDSQSGFGNWSVVAVTSVAQFIVNDSVVLTFGSLASINNVSALNKVRILEYFNISVVVNQLSNSTQWSEVDFTVFDSAQVALGSYCAKNNSAVNGTVTASIFIPSSAFTGQAIVYVCLFDSSNNAIAPEMAVNFEIVHAS